MIHLPYCSPVIESRSSVVEANTRCKFQSSSSTNYDLDWHLLNFHSMLLNCYDHGQLALKLFATLKVLCMANWPESSLLHIFSGNYQICKLDSLLCLN